MIHSILPKFGNPKKCRRRHRKWEAKKDKITSELAVGRSTIVVSSRTRHGERANSMILDPPSSWISNPFIFPSLTSSLFHGNLLLNIFIIRFALLVDINRLVVAMNIRTALYTLHTATLLSREEMENKIPNISSCSSSVFCRFILLSSHFVSFFLHGWRGFIENWTELISYFAFKMLFVYWKDSSCRRYFFEQQAKWMIRRIFLCSSFFWNIFLRCYARSLKWEKKRDIWTCHEMRLLCVSRLSSFFKQTKERDFTLFYRQMTISQIFHFSCHSN